jgi:hypothetical protein
MPNRGREQGDLRVPPDPPDPVDAFVEFGIPRVAAQDITDLLRTSVTDVACTVLPGVDRGAGVRWLWAASAALTHAAPSMARSHLPDLAPGREQTAALPAMWLYPIVVELLARHGPPPDAPIGAQPADEPVPNVALRQAHDLFQAALTDPALVESGRAVARVTQVPIEGEDPAWGGWSLLATVLAFDYHRDLLPLPGRPRERRRDQEHGAHSAGQAFAFGRDLTIATALALLDDRFPA